jgi:hypothetical protein
MEEQIKTKKCTRCEKDKPLTEYYKTGVNGTYARCKTCHYELNYANVKRCLKKKYSEDPVYRQRVLDSSKQNMNNRLSTEEGRQKHNQYCLEYYHKNREKILEQSKKRKKST